MNHGIPVALSTEKGKETDSPLGPPEANVALPTAWFQPSEICVGLLTYKTLRQNICVV